MEQHLPHTVSTCGWEHDKDGDKGRTYMVTSGTACGTRVLHVSMYGGECAVGTYGTSYVVETS